MARKRDIPGARKVRKTLENKAFLRIAQRGIYENVPNWSQMGCDMATSDLEMAIAVLVTGVFCPTRRADILQFRLGNLPGRHRVVGEGSEAAIPELPFWRWRALRRFFVRGHPRSPHLHEHFQVGARRDDRSRQPKARFCRHIFRRLWSARRFPGNNQRKPPESRGSS
jgi:hypothetical protein